MDRQKINYVIIIPHPSKVLMTKCTPIGPAVLLIPVVMHIREKTNRMIELLLELMVLCELYVLLVAMVNSQEL